jgi:cytochrome c-type biogenesis protein CcmE
MKMRRIKWIIGGVLIAVGGGIVLVTSLPKSTQYYVTVDELVAKRDTFLGKTLKVAGTVAPASLKKEPGLRFRFAVESFGKRVMVNYRGALPDTFKEGGEVVVTGSFAGSGELDAVNVLAKCASKYEERLDPGLTSPPEGKR